HLAMRKTERPRNVRRLVGIAGPRIDHDDLGAAGFEIDRQIPGIGVEAQLVIHDGGDLAWFGHAVFENRGNLLCHRATPWLKPGDVRAVWLAAQTKMSACLT